MRKAKSKGNEKGQGKRLPLFFAVPLNFLSTKEQKTWQRRRERKQKRGRKGTQRPSFLPRTKTIHPPLFSHPKTSLFLVLLCIHCHVCKKIFGFEHPHPLLVEILWGWALQQHSGAGRSRGTLRLGFRETLGLGTGPLGLGPGTLGLETLGWALLETVGLGPLGRLWGWAGVVWGWALQGHSRVGHSRDTLGLGAPGMSEE